MGNGKRNGKSDKPRHPEKVKGGHTLIELLVYIALLTVVMNFLYRIFYRDEMLIRRSRQYSESLSDIFMLKDILTEDVRNSSEIPASHRDTPSSETVLFLKQPDRVVSYVFNREKESLLRSIEQDRSVDWGEWHVKNVRFERGDNMVKIYIAPAARSRLFKTDEFVLITGTRNGI